VFERLLAEVASATSLREGPEGVRRILWIAHQEQRIGIRGLSRLARLPVPVVAAVRRELERRDILRRDQGIVISPRGRSLLEAQGMVRVESFACPHCAGRRVVVPAALQPVLKILAESCRERPGVDVRLDQSHGTPQTALHRALYMHECDALFARRVLVLGDDDLLSVAMALLARHFSHQGDMRITVIDIDARILDHIRAVARREDLAIGTYLHDLRTPLPAGLCDRFDAFATDPPYTEDGLRLFASRAIQALSPGSGRQGFVSFAHRGPAEMLSICGHLVQMGLSITEVMPGFNRYEGAQMLAGTSQMLRVATVAKTFSAWEGDCRDPIYTAEVAQASTGSPAS